MRYDATNLPGVWRVIDDATGQEIRQVMWVDDVTLEYGVATGISVWGIAAEQVTTVTRVHVNHAAREIHVNHPPQFFQPAEGRVLHACAECCQHDTCRRIGCCVAHHCAFGEACPP
jgi:hypothetical protein